ncbi:THUMP domain-containing class I SAM-dependent RNA methyltransferase [Corallococcus silvisoli]|uniref:THUMP domain-containing class I SAM-dependent RNA methyltransferase n=1 Tax=Corallococcus silvisoli TaxID=2697031 RepID=UPI001378AD74|nr:RNA methyltransferase [Corallococcus silvisoli]NBD13984.1 RNA methyltransferase [Corallococcus silvisoli]
MTGARSQTEEAVYVSTLPGLEPALEAEAREQGLVFRRAEGGIECEGPAGLHQTANLHLRTASRVLLRLGTFTAPTADALVRGLEALPMGGVWDGKAPLRLSVSLHRSVAPGPGVVLESAAVAWGQRDIASAGHLDEEGAVPGLTLLVRGEGERWTVSADTSGEPLHQRGYRQEVGRAPLRETLAAGILRLAGYTGEMSLVDPMCGSGTFLVEGAWMSQHRAPGLLRTFAFQSFPSFDREAWARRRAEAEARGLVQPRVTPRGYDLNAGALGTARRNAKRAGVTLTLERHDLRTLKAPPEGPGLVVANPPYGKRVGEAEDLPELYRALGATMNGAFREWRKALIVPEEPRLVSALGLQGARRIPVKNGGLRCLLLLAGP